MWIFFNPLGNACYWIIKLHCFASSKGIMGMVLSCKENSNNYITKTLTKMSIFSTYQKGDAHTLGFLPSLSRKDFDLLGADDLGTSKDVVSSTLRLLVRRRPPAGRSTMMAPSRSSDKLLPLVACFSCDGASLISGSMSIRIPRVDGSWPLPRLEDDPLRSPVLYLSIVSDDLSLSLGLIFMRDLIRWMNEWDLWGVLVLTCSASRVWDNVASADDEVSFLRRLSLDWRVLAMGSTSSESSMMLVWLTAWCILLLPLTLSGLLLRVGLSKLWEDSADANAPSSASSTSFFLFLIFILGLMPNLSRKDLDLFGAQDWSPSAACTLVREPPLTGRTEWRDSLRPWGRSTMTTSESRLLPLLLITGLPLSRRESRHSRLRPGRLREDEEWENRDGRMCRSSARLCDERWILMSGGDGRGLDIPSMLVPILGSDSPW